MNLKSLLNQDITIWEQSGVDQFNSPTFSSPSTVKGRKERRTELFRSADATDKVATAVFYLEGGVSIGNRDRIFEGTSTASDPTTVSGAEEVEDVQTVPSVDAQVYLTKVLV